MSDRAYERAEEVQQFLTERGAHRSAGPVDLLIAATAERSGLIVLCDDRDFETVSAVTGQPVRRLASLQRSTTAPEPCSRTQLPPSARHSVTAPADLRAERATVPQVVRGPTRRPESGSCHSERVSVSSVSKDGAVVALSPSRDPRAAEPTGIRPGGPAGSQRAPGSLRVALGGVPTAGCCHGLRVIRVAQLLAPATAADCAAARAARAVPSRRPRPVVGLASCSGKRRAQARGQLLGSPRRRL
jgi:hypothetical protein